MKVLVCISNVPDTTTKITFTDNNTQFNTAGVQYIINPYDEIALARAIELCEGGKGTITVVNVGDASTEPTIRKALAIGADDAIRVNSAPRDAYFVARQIAKLMQVTGYETPAPRGNVKMIDASDPSKLVDALHGEAKVI